MTSCNACGSLMVPDDTALVAALRCVECGRLIPRTGVKHPSRGSGRAEMLRVRRAARRAKTKGGSS